MPQASLASRHQHPFVAWFCVYISLAARPCTALTRRPSGYIFSQAVDARPCVSAARPWATEVDTPTSCDSKIVCGIVGSDSALRHQSCRQVEVVEQHLSTREDIQGWLGIGLRAASLLHIAGVHQRHVGAIVAAVRRHRRHALQGTAAPQKCAWIAPPPRSPAQSGRGQAARRALRERKNSSGSALACLGDRDAHIAACGRL